METEEIKKLLGEKSGEEKQKLYEEGLYEKKRAERREHVRLNFKDVFDLDLSPEECEAYLIGFDKKDENGNSQPDWTFRDWAAFIKHKRGLK